MKVLIAYDGSECADAALADLPRAGLPRDTEALVLSVGDVLLPPPPPSSYEVVGQALASRRVASALAQSQSQASRAIEEARATAERGCEALRSAFPGWGVRAEAVAGAPAWGIIERAQVWPADLVIVGSHGRTALGRLIMGSVSLKVTTEAGNSVRVARCRDGVGGRDDSPVRLLVGFDGSPSARAAVRAVARRAWPAGTTALLVAVAEQSGAPPAAGLIPTAPVTTPDVEGDGLQELRAALETAEDDLSAAAGLHVTCEIREGDAKSVLIEEAKRLRADCIFVGSRGLGGRVERFLLGSVSTALVKDAPCSVEVVRG